MCSFDVCSLFTNVPLDETIEICLTKLYFLPDPPALPPLVLKTLLEFATKKSHFVFDGHYYDQIDDVAMGSPLGPVLANISMCDFEQKFLTNVDSHPSIWFRHVYNTFSLFDSEATAASFLHFLNTRHPNIKSTTELKENQEITFLDVRIKRNLNTFTTTVHPKTTFTKVPPSGTLPLQQSIKSIQSAPSPIAVYASARVLPYYSRLSSF